MGFRVLDHTADIGIEITADDLETVFCQAARAFSDVVTDVDSLEPSTGRRFSLAGDNLEALLVDWLSELLYVFDIDGLLFSRVRASVVEGEGGWRLDAVAQGEAFDSSRHELKVPIKGVTYHGLEVAETPAGIWRARVVFDI